MAPAEPRNIAEALEKTAAAWPDRLALVGEDGAFTFVPATLRARRGDIITWYCEQGEFALHFGTRTPFNKTMLSSQGKQIEEKVHGQAALGAYRYVVAARVGQRVIINACPEIIIEEPPEKPGQGEQ